jgi:aryl-alcohol dehydrogenase-like predicted oxidoreductase
MGSPPPISNQFVYNLLERGIEASTLETCQTLGVGVIGYSPLAQGVLTGKYLGGQCPAGSRAAHAVSKKDMWQHQPSNEAVVGRLSAVAARNGLELAALAIAWCLRLPGVASVLTGASSPRQIRTNAQSALLELTPELLAEVEAALRPTPAFHQPVANNPIVVDMADPWSSVPCN